MHFRHHLEFRQPQWQAANCLQPAPVKCNIRYNGSCIFRCSVSTTGPADRCSSENGPASCCSSEKFKQPFLQYPPKQLPAAHLVPKAYVYQAAAIVAMLIITATVFVIAPPTVPVRNCADFFTTTGSSTH